MICSSELEVLQSLHHQTSPGIEILLVSPEPKYSGKLSLLIRIGLKSGVSMYPTNSTMRRYLLMHGSIVQNHVIHCSGSDAIVSPMDIPNTVPFKYHFMLLAQFFSS